MSTRACARKPQSSVNVLLAVRRWHAKRGLEMAPIALVRRVLDGLTRRFVALHGPEALLPDRKEPFTDLVVDAMFAVPAGTSIGGRLLDWDNVFFRSWRLGLALTRQAAFRKGEIAPVERTNADLSRASVVFRIDGVIFAAPSRAQLLSMRAGRDAIGVRPPRLKNDQFQLHFGTHVVWCPLDDSPNNAARCAIDLELCAPIAPHERAATPLLIASSVTRDALTPRLFDSVLRDLLVLGVGPDQAKHYSAHSGRIELACRLLAAGASRPMIQALCRWRGESALDIYARINASDYEAWTRRAAAASIDSIEATSLPTIDSDIAAIAATSLAAALGGLGGAAVEDD
jgi:hypothetical protein